MTSPLEFWAFTAMTQVQSLVGVSSCKPCGATKKTHKKPTYLGFFRWAYACHFSPDPATPCWLLPSLITHFYYLLGPWRPLRFSNPALSLYSTESRNAKQQSVTPVSKLCVPRTPGSCTKPNMFWLLFANPTWSPWWDWGVGSRPLSEVQLLEPLL